MLPRYLVPILCTVLFACGGVREEQPPAVPTQDRGTDDPPAVDVSELREVNEAYYVNVIRQIRRCYRAPSGSEGYEAVVSFSIGADGKAREVRLERSSGNENFDRVAVEAIRDCAGMGAFGPPPEGLEPVPYPIVFTFRSGG